MRIKTPFLTRNLILLFLFITNFLIAQESSDEQKFAPEGWHNYDHAKQLYNGVRTAEAYALLEGKKSETVIVAVIDSGVDVDHEDLQGSIWVNEDEVPGNGIDDDKNGYVDDVNGWNFLGPVKEDTYEVTRLFVKYHKIFGDKTAEEISKTDQKEYELYQKLKRELDSQLAKNREQYTMIDNFYQVYTKALRLIRAYLDTEEITLGNLNKLNSPDHIVTGARDILKYGFELDVSEELLFEQREHFRVIIEYGYNVDFDPRYLVGDDFEDAYQKYYGDNNVKGFASHGTQVAGVIAAQRNNGIGINGIADNVKIMVLRAVPDGDERDKDVANAIIYAVDNGADIINMSFGKRFSPRKEAVDKAIAYADSKGVLMIHASGNDSKDVDITSNFPAKYYSNTKKYAKGWLEIGASSWGAEDNFVATFSNYGKKTVDVFAPGVAIHTTSPDNEYKSVDGTSFACPLTAGVAALIMSYFPNLTSTEVRDVIVKSAVDFKDLEVNKPAGHDKEAETVKFGDLSATGGIVNAYEAVKLASSMTVGKKD